jgi:hypothetical protein
MEGLLEIKVFNTLTIVKIAPRSRVNLTIHRGGNIRRKTPREIAKRNLLTTPCLFGTGSQAGWSPNVV